MSKKFFEVEYFAGLLGIVLFTMIVLLASGAWREGLVALALAVFILAMLVLSARKSDEDDD